MKKMKIKKKKSIMVTCFLGAVVVGAIGFGHFTAQAFGMLTGIETTVSNKVDTQESYHILEVIPDDSVGEIGYLVKDSEPVPLQSNMNDYFTQSQVDNTKESRVAYVTSLSDTLTGIYSTDNTTPLAYEGDYTETYFPTAIEQQNMNLITFTANNYEQTTLTGQFVKNTEGEGTYDENIVSFTYSEAGGYYVEFESKMAPQEGEEHYGEALYSQPYEYKAGGYYQLVTNPKNNVIYSYISSFAYYGSDTTSAKYVANMDTEYLYQYVGTNGYYDFVEGESAQSEEGSTEVSINAPYQIEIGQVYYQGGYTNNEWFKNKIFAAQQITKAQNLNIEVTTVTESELSNTDLSDVDFIYICGDTTNSGKEYTKNGDNWNKVLEIYTLIQNSNIPCLIDSSVLSHISDNTVTSDIDKLLLMCLTQTELPTAELNWEDLLTQISNQENYPFFKGEDTNYIANNVYFMDTKDGTENRESCFADFETNIEDIYDDITGFAEVSAMINSENAIRSGNELLDTKVSKVTGIQYIINYQNKREIVQKDKVTILDIEPAWGNEYSNAASTKVLTEEKVRSDWGINATTISIIHMTTAEFIGKINDLNTDYDIIYIGIGYDGDYMQRDSEGNAEYNDSYMGNLIYSHTGDLAVDSPALAGILDTDYVNAYAQGSAARSNYLYNYDTSLISSNQDAYGYRLNKTEVDGVTHLTQTLVNISNFPISWRYNKKTYTANDWATVTVGNVGTYRYGGNDIPKDKLQSLLEYVGAKYPVVVANDIMNGTDINRNIVDNSSYLYEFLNEVKTADNFYEYSGVKVSATFANYLNLSKLAISFYNPQGSDTEITEAEFAQQHTVVQGDLRTDSNNYGNEIVEVDKANADSTASYTLRMRFAVNSEVDVSTNTRYILRYYMDLNADGKYTISDNYSELMSDILVYDASGTEATRNANGEYELSSGQTYTLEKVIPAKYRGVLPWKIEACQISNEAIRTSYVSYTVLSPETGEETQDVSVLQIVSDNSNTFDLSTNNSFKTLLTQITNTVGLEFHIVTVTTSEFNQYFSNNRTISNKTKQGYLDILYNSLYPQNGAEITADYDMLIFGFADCYGDSSLDSDEAMTAIKKFAATGKSILFTHDTTSFANVSSNSNWTAAKVDSNDGSLTQVTDTWWGYKFNTQLRELAGMDRYGVTTTVENYASDLTDEDKLNFTRANLLKQGQLLNLTKETDETGTLSNVIAKINVSEGGYTTRVDQNGEALGTESNGVSIGIEKDLAYVADSNRTQSYGETQGYTYGMLDSKLLSDYTQYKSLKYNYKRDTTVAEQVNDGQITHYPYEIGTELDIATTHYQYYQLDMDADADGDGNSDIVVWYCLGSNNTDAATLPDSYSVSPNDVRNNYYIYSIGNIMYTGVGHSNVSNLNEMKLFANTLVAAYKATIQKPNVTILESSDRTSSKKSYDYIAMEQSINSESVDSEQALDSEVSFYYTVTDPNLATSAKNISAKYWLVSSDGTQVAQIDTAENATQAYISTEDTNGQYVVEETNSNVSKMVSGHVYFATLHNIATDSGDLKTLLDSGKFKICVEVESSFTYYGAEASAKTSTDTLTIMKTNLFDLQ